MEDQLAEEFAALEKRFAALENKYNDLRTNASQNSLPCTACEKNSKTMKVNNESQEDQNKKSEEKKSDEAPLAVVRSPRRGKVVSMQYDDEKSTYVEHLSEESRPEDSKSKATHAYVLKKFPKGNDVSVSELSINGPELLKLLRDLLRHYPYHHFLGDVAFLKAPYESIILNWDILEAASVQDAVNDDDRLARSDLRLLLQDLSQGSGDEKLDRYLQSRDALKNQGSITFDNLWTIFPPGTVVCGRSFCFKQDQLFIVEDNTTPWPEDTPTGEDRVVFELRAWIYDWDGKVFNRRSLKLRITEFEDQKPITSLAYYPLVNNKEHRAVIERELLERGKNFRQYCVSPPDERLFKYKGLAILDRKGFRGVRKSIDWGDDRYDLDEEATQPTAERKTLVDSKVMVDFESYYKYGQATAQVGTVCLYGESGECDCASCKKNAALKEMYRSPFDGCTGHEDWDDLQYQLCPPRLLGYVLHDKRWAQLDVTKIEEIKRVDSDNAYTSELHLGGEKEGVKVKQLLFGLVKNHGIGEAGQDSEGYDVDDIVEHKGKGLVILLYGPPGVGKTSTAETVAIAAKKPLFSIGVADVGTSASHVENNLQRIFDLATTWRAVLLIDEADVFVQSRMNTAGGPSTERNALVSVFLRVLEYYKGILILTTNQIAQFDIAVVSRIHVAVKYDKLDKTQTTKIFKGFLDQFVKRGVVAQKFEIEAYVEDDLYREHFDGRQIRNIVTSAVGLARASGEKLTLRHVKSVVVMVKAFQDDLNKKMIAYDQSQKVSKYD